MTLFLVAIDTLNMLLIPLLILVAAVVIAVLVLRRQKVGELTHLKTPEGEVISLGEDRTCAGCKHFDQEEGQAAMKQFPIFVQAAQHIPPAEMGRTVVSTTERDCRACEGKGKVPRPPGPGVGELHDCTRCEGTGKQTDEQFSKPCAPAKADWSQFGACMQDEVVVWGGDKKDCWVDKRV
jgi:hypothetical protein